MDWIYNFAMPDSSQQVCNIIAALCWPTMKTPTIPVTPVAPAGVALCFRNKTKLSDARSQRCLTPTMPYDLHS